MAISCLNERNSNLQFFGVRVHVDFMCRPIFSPLPFFSWRHRIFVMSPTLRVFKSTCIYSYWFLYQIYSRNSPQDHWEKFTIRHTVKQLRLVHFCDDCPPPNLLTYSTLLLPPPSLPLLQTPGKRNKFKEVHAYFSKLTLYI